MNQILLVQVEVPNTLKKLTEDHMIKEFLKIEKNLQLYNKYLLHPTIINKNSLDDSFKEFFIEAKFTSYISSLIRLYSIDFDKRQRRLGKRNILISEDEKFNVHAFPSVESEFSLKEARLDDIATSVQLHKAISRLTDKEKKTLLLAYVFEYSDTEVSKLEGVSQQAISKTRLKSLKKIKDFLLNRKE